MIINLSCSCSVVALKVVSVLLEICTESSTTTSDMTTQQTTPGRCSYELSVLFRIEKKVSATTILIILASSANAQHCFMHAENKHWKHDKKPESVCWWERWSYVLLTWLFALLHWAPTFWLWLLWYKVVLTSIMKRAKVRVLPGSCRHHHPLFPLGDSECVSTYWRTTTTAKSPLTPSTGRRDLWTLPNQTLRFQRASSKTSQALTVRDFCFAYRVSMKTPVEVRISDLLWLTEILTPSTKISFSEVQTDSALIRLQNTSPRWID